MSPTSPPERPVRVLLIGGDPDDHATARGLLDEAPVGRFHLDWVSD